MPATITSGAVINSTDNALVLATRLTRTLDKYRACGIAIANDTDFVLTKPHQYLETGKILSMPLEIKPGQTGLIAAYNRTGLLEGTWGMVSYKFQKPDFNDFKQIQVLWAVPVVKKCAINVRIGCESASQDVYEEMLLGTAGYGNMVEAMGFGRNAEFNQNGVLVRYWIGEESKAPVFVHLRNVRT